MNESVKRLYVEKKAGFDIEAQDLLNDLKDNLGIKNIKRLRILNRYDISGISEDEYKKTRDLIFSEKTVDDVYEEEFPIGENSYRFSVEYLPGQYDQRADSACQCVSLLIQRDGAIVKTAKVIVLEGEIEKEDFEKIKRYFINPVDSREAANEKPATLSLEADVPEDIKVLEGFIAYTDELLEGFLNEFKLAMSIMDLKLIREYFKNIEKRDPTLSEIKVIDTYWSDHCRHTTFLTNIEEVKIEDDEFTAPVKKAYEEYKKSREYVYEGKEKEVCLMDIALIGMKEFRKRGLLCDLDVSDEINASSIEIDADVNGKNEKWLLMFKNETHNHPTEIEPFGGAATCLGGAIRDPLSGRAYVYQAMRISGSGDPRTRIEDTLPGKLPQRKITIGAAQGYSSYGNQIGIATGQVSEIYDEGFIAKRMELGAVIGAALKENVIRKEPKAHDVVLLIGGRTGRDGIGGATGSSKEHDEKSIINCGTEVQKGNPVTERKIQRLFRNPKVSRMIKRCNDFGAGGVSVAIGELADGLNINLDLVPKKYEGLDGTELAISESQERMAVVVDEKDAKELINLAHEENVEATLVALVTDEKRLKMRWRGKYIVDLSREFLNTNGVRQRANAVIKAPYLENYFKLIPQKVKSNLQNIKTAWLYNLQELNVCSKKGLAERFDSTIGAGTVLMPFGGKYQLTPSEGMAAKIPVLDGETKTASLMAYGYNPKIGRWSPFHGAVYSIVEAVTKIAAMGGDYKKIRLSLQEYFGKSGNDPEKWGQPFASLLGALYAQKRLSIPSIGGKDSMSGSFKELDVPPTLVAFAVTTASVDNVISSEFKKTDSIVVLIPCERDETEIPKFDALKKNLSRVTELISQGKILSASSVRGGGISETISKMCFGNMIGMKFNSAQCAEKLFEPIYGSLIVEVSNDQDLVMMFKGIDYEILGFTKKDETIEINGEVIPLKEAYESYEKPLEGIFKTKCETIDKPIKNIKSDKTSKTPVIKFAKPRVFIPVFPGTNCEYDSQRAFERAGGIVETFIFKNISDSDIKYSIEEIVKRIKNSEIIMLPGGFSAGDEPDGSGKFIAAVFRNEKVKEALMEFLNKKDGLILGICNGFQALIKLGLVPYGEIRDLDEESPTLTYNSIGRHVSCMVRTKVVSKLSPWFNNVKLGDVHTIPVSHGEGRFVCSEVEINKLIENGQIATQYVDFEGNATYDIKHNPNGSFYAVEAITSPDGRVLGKMGHSERIGYGLYKNVPGEKDQKLFEAGIDYFRGGI